MYYYGLPSTTPAGLLLPVPTYPTSGPTATKPYLPTSSTLAYSRAVFTYLSSLSMGAAATATPSSTTATTSGVTSYPSGPFTVGVIAFVLQSTLLVPVTTASTLSSATVMLGLPMQNSVVPGAGAVRGSTFSVGVTIAGILSTTTATIGSAPITVKSIVDGATPSTPLPSRVSRQLRRCPPVPVPVRQLVLRRRRLPETGRLLVRRRRQHMRRLPVHPSSSCVSSRQSGCTPEVLPGNCSAITSALSRKSTRGPHLTN